MMARDAYPLRGSVVVITGVSRRAGIGHAVACRLAAYGADLVCHHFAPHDYRQPWGGDDVRSVMASVREHLVGGARLVDVHADLTESGAPKQLVDVAVMEFGRVDAVVCNQALSGSDGAVTELTADDLDLHWAVDTRSSILLAQAFAARHVAGRRGTVVFMTSGQQRGPMPGEVAYAAAKAGLLGVTATIADELADRGIRVNCVNPGPVDTGYMTEEAKAFLVQRFPFGRIGTPDDAAKVVAWLCTDEAAWITGHVLDSEGGFRR